MQIASSRSSRSGELWRRQVRAPENYKTKALRTRRRVSPISQETKKGHLIASISASVAVIECITSIQLFEFLAILSTNQSTPSLPQHFRTSVPEVPPIKT